MKQWGAQWAVCGWSTTRAPAQAGGPLPSSHGFRLAALPQGSLQHFPPTMACPSTEILTHTSGPTEVNQTILMILCPKEVLLLSLLDLNSSHKGSKFSNKTNLTLQWKETCIFNGFSVGKDVIAQILSQVWAIACDTRNKPKPLLQCAHLCRSIWQTTAGLPPQAHSPWKKRLSINLEMETESSCCSDSNITDGHGAGPGHRPHRGLPAAVPREALQAAEGNSMDFFHTKHNRAWVLQTKGQAQKHTQKYPKLEHWNPLA